MDIEVVVSMLVAVFLGDFVVDFIITNRRKKVNEKLPEGKKDEPPFVFLARDIGKVERALYVLAWYLNFSSFLAIWLGFKIASKWSQWGDKDHSDPQTNNLNRARFNLFLLGNALSILVTIITIIIVNQIFD